MIYRVQAKKLVLVLVSAGGECEGMVCVYMRVYTCVHVHVCMCMYVYVHMCVRVCMCTYVCVCGSECGDRCEGCVDGGRDECGG